MRGRAYVAAAGIAGRIHVFGGSDGGQVRLVEGCQLELFVKLSFA